MPLSTAVGKLKVRTVVRLAIAFLGVIELFLFVWSGFQSVPDAFGGGMLLFISATNFCTQCPLLSAITRMFKRERTTISTEKL
ncbi:MAG: hypothetical protein WCW40_00350 [Bacteroidota bacterium]